MRILFTIAILLWSTVLFAQKSVTVVIDAGHGGKDPGHLSGFSGFMTEKELNLKIAQFVGNYIEKYLQNVKVIYTRKDDTFLTLDERVQIANKYSADYFISVHCNGNDNSKVKGTETHVHAFELKKSYQLAKEIESQFKNRAGRTSRGVKETKDRTHSIQVLKYTRMTSVLVECGFLTNPADATFLNTVNGQEIIASAIYRGFRTFIQKEHPKIDFVRKQEEITEGNFAIQLHSSIDPVETTHEYFKKLDVVRTKVETTSKYKYRYTYGNYSSREAAKAKLKELQALGFKDAFVIKL